jgi:hypothetical protein
MASASSCKVRWTLSGDRCFLERFSVWRGTAGHKGRGQNIQAVAAMVRAKRVLLFEGSTLFFYFVCMMLGGE